jgi:hypothetical protein
LGLLNGVALSIGCGGIDKMIRGRRKVGGGSLVEGSDGRGTFYASISFCLDPCWFLLFQVLKWGQIQPRSLLGPQVVLEVTTRSPN